MLDCDGWEHATAYHDAIVSTIAGHAVGLVPLADGELGWMQLNRIDLCPLPCQSWFLNVKQLARSKAAIVLVHEAHAAHAHTGAESD